MIVHSHAATANKAERQEGARVTDPITQTLTGPRRNALARRERIISAARALFARQGFHGTGMAQIAQVSEVLVGQIYRDFAGKEDLIAAIVERDVVEMLDDPELAGAMSSGEAAQLNRWLRKFIARRLDQESRSMFADILSEATRNAKIAAFRPIPHTVTED
jgi:AcrR family transcriptional regulator